MIVYSVQCIVNAQTAAAWEEYFKKVHLDDVMNTGCFTGVLFKKEKREGGHYVFIAEYYCPSPEMFEKYNTEFAPDLKKDIKNRFEGQFSARRKVFDLVLRK